MILIALGSNLAGGFGSPQGACEAALRELAARGVKPVRVSSWYCSPAQPPSSQPDFVNGVAAVEFQKGARLAPKALLALLHEIETQMGRRRSLPNAARIIDLDLLAYDDRICRDSADLQLPHPRLGVRAFVLLPLAEIAPDWVHPESGAALSELIAAMPAGQGVERLA